MKISIKLAVGVGIELLHTVIQGHFHPQCMVLKVPMGTDIQLGEEEKEQGGFMSHYARLPLARTQSLDST